jgi:uncharacterized membrane protein (Fun14 family)
MDFIVPFVGTLGFGGLMGYAVGYAAKKIAKVVLVAIGVLFFLIQYLVYQHLAHVDWAGVAHHGGAAAKAGGLAFWKIATYNVPLGAGFVAGILLGLRKG